VKTRHVIYCYTNKINRKSYVGQALCKPGIEPIQAVVMRRKGGYESCRIFFTRIKRLGPKRVKKIMAKASQAKKKKGK
jgi:hypothetical protein